MRRVKWRDYNSRQATHAKAQGTRASLTELHFLGGCKTIGSSAYLVRENDTSILCDFGVSFNGNPTFPLLTRPSNLIVALSHAHLDHSGGIPLLFASGSVPVYMTAITRDLIRILLKDMIRLSNYFLPFEREELERLRQELDECLIPAE